MKQDEGPTEKLPADRLPGSGGGCTLTGERSSGERDKPTVRLDMLGMFSMDAPVLNVR